MRKLCNEFSHLALLCDNWQTGETLHSAEILLQRETAFVSIWLLPLIRGLIRMGSTLIRKNFLFLTLLHSEWPKLHSLIRGLIHMGSTLIRQNFLFLCPATKSGGVLCYTLRTFECLSVRLSVRPSVCPSAVEHSCPVHNFDTV